MICLTANALCIPFINSNSLTPNSDQWPSLCSSQAPANERMTSAPHLGHRGTSRCLANASAPQDPLSSFILEFVGFSRALLFSSLPWEFPVFLCLPVPLWESLAHLFLLLFFPLFISFFTARYHGHSKVPETFHCQLCYSQQYSSSCHCYVHLLYFIYTFLESHWRWENRLCFWKGWCLTTFLITPLCAWF